MLISVQVMKGNTVITPEISKFAIPTIKRKSPTMMKIINEQTILGSVKSAWLIGAPGIGIVLGIGCTGIASYLRVYVELEVKEVFAGEPCRRFCFINVSQIMVL